MAPGSCPRAPCPYSRTLSKVSRTAGINSSPSQDRAGQRWPYCSPCRIKRKPRINRGTTVQLKFESQRHSFFRNSCEDRMAVASEAPVVSDPAPGFEIFHPTPSNRRVASLKQNVYSVLRNERSEPKSNCRIYGFFPCAGEHGA